MHLLHAYVNVNVLPYPHMKLPTVLLALSQQPLKLKYSSLIRCLQHMIYFDIPMPAVENIHG